MKTQKTSIFVFKIATILFALALPASVIAKSVCKENCRKVSYGSVGIQLVDLTSLNSRLNSLGITDFDEIAPALSIGHYKTVGRFIHGGNFASMFWRKNYDNNRVTSLWAGHILVTAGFNLLSENKPLRLFPETGIGAGVFKLRNNEYKRSFDQALTVESNNLHLWKTALLLSVGAGADFTLPPIKKMNKSLIVGLRAGYTFSPVNNKEWREMGGTQIVNGPSPRMTGLYASIVTGKMLTGKKDKKHGYQEENK